MPFRAVAVPMTKLPFHPVVVLKNYCRFVQSESEKERVKRNKDAPHPLHFTSKLQKQKLSSKSPLSLIKQSRPDVDCVSIDTRATKTEQGEKVNGNGKKTRFHCLSSLCIVSTPKQQAA